MAFVERLGPHARLRPTYHVTAERDGRWWILKIRELHKRS